MNPNYINQPFDHPDDVLLCDGGFYRKQYKLQGLDFFAEGIKAFQPTRNHTGVRVRILPGMDSGLDLHDERSRLSVISYRTEDGTISGFYTTHLAHPYWGSLKRGMLSPKSLETLVPGQYPEDQMRDPVEDCYKIARKSPEWVGLTERHGTEPQILAMPRRLAFFNALYQHSGNAWEQGVLILSNSSLKHLEEQLNWLKPTVFPNTHNQKAYQEYLLGDITDPAEGLIAKVLPTDMGEIRPYCMHYASSPYALHEVKIMAVSEEDLQRRVSLFDPRNFKVYTPQQMVHMMTEDGCLPRELIKRACGDYADIPS